MKNNRPIIAHINRSFFGGSETFIYHYISNLKQFHPICLGEDFVNLDQFPFPEEDLCSISIKWHLLRRPHHKITRRNFKRSTIVDKIVKKKNAKLLHAHFGKNGVYALQAKKRLEVPLITSFYGIYLSKLVKKKVGMEEYTILFREGDLFLVEGPHMKSKLENLGCPARKIQIQRIAIELDRIPFMTRKPKKPGGKVILIFSGRFVEKKGLIYALKAIKEARKVKNNFVFLIIGDGPLKSETKNFITTNEMSEYVQMPGFLSYENYLKEMQKADIFIQPSVTASNGDSEGGAPTTILEAQAMGMPVISSYHADIPNIVIPGKSALLANEKDWKMLSTHIVHLLENQETWEQMGHTGRRFVETHHDIKKEITTLEGKYDLLLQTTYA